MKKIKIAQIGLNTYSHGKPTFQRLERLSELFEIAGFALPENEKERLPQWKEIFAGYQELSVEKIINDPTIEAVTIETDEIYLTKYALMAARAGKHIQMEKPGGTSLAAFEELIATMKQTGKVFQTGYMYRYNPYVIEALEKVRRGDLGEIISVEAQMNCAHPKEMREWLDELPGGMMFYLGCHLIDLIYSIQGAPQKIYPFNKCSHFEIEKGKDFGMAILEYPHGISFAKTTAIEMGGFERRQLVINGTKGTIELHPLEWIHPNKLQNTAKREVYTTDWKTAAKTEWCEPFDRYEPMLRGFGEMILGKRENPYTLDYELELFKLILKACGE